MKWGGEKHDVTHSKRDWVSFINVYLGRVVEGSDGSWEPTDKEFTEAMVKVAALATAAVEATNSNEY